MTTAAGLTLSAGGASLLVLSAALSLAEGRRARILPGSIGLLSPNAVALALTEHPSVAGSAFALLGVSQYVIRGASTPLVGIAGSRTALPVTLTNAARSAAAVACYLLVARMRRSRAPTSQWPAEVPPRRSPGGQNA